MDETVVDFSMVFFFSSDIFFAASFKAFFLTKPFKPPEGFAAADNLKPVFGVVCFIDKLSLIFSSLFVLFNSVATYYFK